MKTGTIAIIGRPNVGKSTLLNTLLPEKISIVSDKPQTTRTRIVGVVHRPTSQLVLLDTPGLHEPTHLLNKRMVRTTWETIREADLLYMMVEATAPPRPGEHWIVEQVQRIVVKEQKPVFLLLSKVDLVKKPRLLPLIQAYRELAHWTEVVPVSAKERINIDRLLDSTETYLPEGPPLYDENFLTDQTLRTLASEIIREKILFATSEEIPHSVAVEIEQFQEEGKIAHLVATIYVERDTQKPIIVGRKGDRLKAVGTAARVDLERFVGKRIYLKLWVKVKRGWRENNDMLVDLGY